MRRRILLIAIVGAVVAVVLAALVWQLWGASGPPRARTYGSARELASDLYRARGECQHPQPAAPDASRAFLELVALLLGRAPAPPVLHTHTYRCSVAGGRLYFFVYTPEMVKDLKAIFGEEYERFIPEVGDFQRTWIRVNTEFLDHPDSGEVVGPNWVAMSEWRVTLQAVHQAIGGRLIIPMSTPRPSPTHPSDRAASAVNRTSTSAVGGNRALCVSLARTRSSGGPGLLGYRSLFGGMEEARKTGNPISPGWFHISDAVEGDLSETQRRFLLVARERLDSLAPSGASASGSWASREPERSGTSTLWLCVPLVGERHESLQLGLWGDTIVGGWQDRHYAWDDPKGERFRMTIEPDSVDSVIARALDWLESEMRSRELV